MKFIKKTDDEKYFFDFWSDYKKRNITGLNYDVYFIEYYLITEQQNLVSDESFVYVSEETPPKCLGICFFPIYQKDNVVYSTSVAPIASMKKYLDSCFEYIENLALEFKIQKIEMNIDIMYSQCGQWKYNYLRDYNFIDTTINDSIFLLNKDKNELFYELNRSSRKQINKFINSDKYQFNLYNKNNITPEIFNQYKKCHYICSGRQTRTDDSFNFMLELIKKSKSMLLELNFEGKGIGYLVVFLSEEKYVSLASIANLPEYEINIPIYRLLYWKTIELFCDEYELLFYGYPAGNSLVEGFRSYMDKKELKIAKFKQHMGGITTPHFKGVKYFDKDLMIKDIDLFKEKIGEIL